MMLPLPIKYIFQSVNQLISINNQQPLTIKVALNLLFPPGFEAKTTYSPLSSKVKLQMDNECFLVTFLITNLSLGFKGSVPLNLGKNYKILKYDLLVY